MNKFTLVRYISYGILLSSLTACGGGGGSSSPAPTPSTPTPTPTPSPINVSGGGVKGPLANAVVTVYAFDASQSGFKGSVVATASTDTNAAITGLTLPSPVTPPYIMEFTSVPGTTDITTGLFPVITALRTVITQALLDGGDPLYATPLTTMAVDIAVTNAADSNGTAGIQADEFETALTAAASQVVSTLGFGLNSSVDIFDTPPLVDNTTTSTQQQTDVAAYRAAVEAVTAIAFQINKQSSGGDTDSVLTELAADLADGIIDGNVNGVPARQINASTLQVLQQNPATLPIPNSPTNQTVAEVQAILVTEAATTAPTTPVTELDAGGSITTTPTPAETNPDSDNDGVLNADDAFPGDPAESVDSDGDGIGDNADTDDDNNGILDVDEGKPVNVTAVDTDGDGIDDFFPDNCPAAFNPSQTNTDELLAASDTLGDACDSDDDGDGVLDIADAFPLDDTESVDTDNDGIGDVADPDDDDDGVLDTNDVGNSPLDGTACSLLIDCDGDGVFDSVDFAPIDPAVTANFAPVANNSSAITDEDNAVTFKLNVTDDGVAPGSLAFAITGPVNGNLSGIASNNLTYTPTAEFSGSDSFTFTATDSDGKVSNISTVTITVNSVNDLPVISQAGPIPVTMDEDGAPTTFVAPAIDAADVDVGDTLTWSLSSAAGSGVASVTGAGASPSVTYAPNTNFNGSDSFEATVTDASGGSAAVTIDVIVNAQNDAPVVSASGPFSIAENAINTTSVGAVIAADIDSVITGYAITGGNTGTAFAVDASGQITVNDTTAIDFESAASFNLTVTATDGITTSNTGTVVVNITDANDTAPIVTAGQSFPVAVTAVNLTIVGSVVATDVDTVGTITGYAITAGDLGELVIDSSGQITVNSPLSVAAGGSYSLTVTATDGTNTSTGETVTVNVVSNTPPVINQTGPLLVTMDEDSNGFPIDVAAPVITASDFEGNSLTWSTSGAANGLAEVGGTNVSSPSLFSYTPSPDFNGNDSFVVDVTDGTSTVSIAINITVNPQNDAPTITGSPAISVSEGAAYSFTPGGGDIDAGDTVTYSITGKPSWASFDTATGALTGTPAPGDAATYSNIVIDVTDGNSPAVALPTFSITVSSGVDLTGVWNFIFTPVSGSDNPPGCSTGSTVDTFAISIKQANGSLEFMVNGNQLTGGTINAATGAFNITGPLTKTVVDLADVIDPKFEDLITTENITFTATGMTGGTITGSATTDDGSCVAFDDVTATLIYRPTGLENYDGVYAFESAQFNEHSDNIGVIEKDNEGFPFELEFVGTVVNVYFPDELGPDETLAFSANTFDPVTGYFTFIADFTEKEDFNNDGFFDFSRVEQFTIRGIFLDDPGVTPGTDGAPIVFMTLNGVSYEYNGDFDIGGVLTGAANSIEDFYGKRLTTTAFTRTALLEQGDQREVAQVRLGLQAPPLKRTGPNSKLFLQVLDGATVLCEGPFADDGTGSFLYSEQINQPNPDFSLNQFRGGPYSSVTCNTSDAAGVDQVTTGATYKIRIVDTGNDGVKDTNGQVTAVNDDTIMFDSDVDLGGYQAEVVAPGERFTNAPKVSDLNVNGATTSRTMGGKVIPLYGYFDESEPLTVSWPAQEVITDGYQLRVHEAGDFIVNRYNRPGTTTNVTLPAGGWLDDTATILRLYARDKTTSTPNTQTRTVSRGLIIQNGVRGLFNIELGSTVPDAYRIMQVYLETEAGGSVTCVGSSNNFNVSCSGASVNFATDIVTLNMNDNTGGLGVGLAGSPFVLELHFKADGVNITSSQAEVTSPTVPGVPTTVNVDPVLRTTSARVVNFELEIRTQRLSNAKIQSLVVMINPVGDGMFDQAIFKSDTTATIFTTNVGTNIDTDTFSASEFIWNDSDVINSNTMSDQLLQFTVVPTDNNISQLAGRYTLDFTGSGLGWGYGFGEVLKKDTYKLILRDTSLAEPDLVFRRAYLGNDAAANDPNAYVAPTLSDVIVKLVSAATSAACTAGTCDFANPVITGPTDAASFNLEWTVTTSPVGSRWGLIVNNLTTGEQVRTRRMLPDAFDSEISSVDNLDTTMTYTWTNPGDIVAPAGEILEINIMVSSGEPGSNFVNLGTMVTAHRVHVTQ